jgi:carboxyl-terminal processing protease
MHSSDSQDARVARRKTALGAFALGNISAICLLTCACVALLGVAQTTLPQGADLSRQFAQLSHTPTATAASAEPSLATETAESAELPEEDEQAFLRRIWGDALSIVNDEYAYADFRGVDWRSRRAAIDDKIAQGMSRDDFYDAISAEIDALKDDHSSFSSPGWSAYFESRESYGTGISMAINPRTTAMTVLSVDAGSPAERAGIRPHMRVHMINDKHAVLPDGSERRYKFSYEPDESNTLIVSLPGGPKRPIVFSLQRYPIHEQAHRALLLPRSRTGGKKIGYMFVPSFSGSFAAASFASNLEQLVRSADGELDGLIIDVRVNSGGGEWILQRTFAMLSDKDVIGVNKDRDGDERPLRLDGREDVVGNSLRVPVAVLIGPNTISASEIFAGCLNAQYPERVTLVGERTAGNIEAVRSFDLDDGSTLSLAVETFHRPDGSTWEGVGLDPDIVVNAGWDEVTDARDPVVDAAIRALKK